jgi:hypothetical protein
MFADMDNFEASLPDKGEILRKLRRATDFLERHVIQIFRLDENNNPDLEGSGILARLDDRFYLVTAAHVLDACDTGVFLLQEGFEGEPLAGAFIVSGKKPGTTRLDDKVDIGFVRLTEKETNRLGVDNFLDLNHISGPPMKIGPTVFLVLGYPVRDQVRDCRSLTIETSLTMFMTTPAKEKAYNLASINSESHILLKYDRKVIATKKSIGSPPDFRGLSGGGVWPLSVLEEPSIENPPLLAGIIIERPKGFASSLLVTRGNVIRYFVKRFDES